MARERDRKPAKAAAKEKPSNTNADKKRFIELTYKIIEAKVLYYHEHLIAPGYRDELRVSDDVYDQWELEYLKLCRKLGYPNTVVHKDYMGYEDVAGGMMEVDFTKASVHLVMRKWGIKNWQDKCTQLSDGDRAIIEDENERHHS